MESNPQQPTRRAVLQGVAALAGLAAISACAPGLGASGGESSTAVIPSGSSTAVDRYKGVTLRFLAQAGTAYQPALEAWAKAFKQQTGGTVEFDWTPWESMLPKAQTALTAPGSVDMFLSDIEFQYSLYQNLLDLNEAIGGAGYDTSGWFTSVQNYGSGIDGVAGSRYGLALTAATPITVYRADSSFAAPQNWDDFDALLADSTGGGRFGLAYSGAAAATVKNFLPRFRSFGGVLLTPEWVPQINSDAGVEALTLLAKQAQYMPEGYLSWDDAAASQAFLNGDVAVLETWSSFVMPKIQDPAASKVVDKWVVAPLPGNPAGHFTQHNANIFKASKNPAAAFEFLAMVTGKDSSVELMAEYKEDSARKTAWEDAGVLADRPYLTDLAPALDVAKPFARGYSGWLELFLALGDGVQSAIAGKATPKEALDAAAGRWNETLAKSKPSFPYSE